MATQVNHINGWDSGWPTGSLANIDEAVAGADGFSISTTIDTDVVVLDIQDFGGINDGGGVLARGDFCPAGRIQGPGGFENVDP